jgi:hypothetical protein
MMNITKTQNYSRLITDLASLIEQGRKAAVRYVNTALVATYWLIGRRIVEYEQKGKERAEYGEATLRKISDDLTKRFGKGFSFPQLKNIRQFYLTYPEKGYPVSSQLEERKSETPSWNSEITLAIYPLTERFPLSWSHLEMKIVEK